MKEKTLNGLATKEWTRFATIIGIFADIVHMTPALAGDDEAMGMIATDSEIEAGMQAMSKIAAIITMTFTNNITNGSYVEGLYETMETFRDPTKAPEFLAKIASGFVPTGLTWTENLVEKTLKFMRLVSC